jgi:hypothetical protein
LFPNQDYRDSPYECENDHGDQIRHEAHEDHYILISDFIIFQKAVMPFVAENDVIQKFNTEGLSGFFQALGDFDVFFAWDESAGWMVVGDDDG